MDIEGWLVGLGLGEYATAFRENQIDNTVLLKLTAEDLKELGVATVGQRRKLLAAIQELSNASASSAETITPSIANSLRPTSTGAGERRQLTVMFCDLVGSTALAARLDAEDMSDLIRAFHDVVTAMVARFDGHVAQFLGDGNLIFFGYPRAHEDDAERATHAAVAIVEAVGTLGRQRDFGLEVRVGIATGLVVVGELISGGSARERGVVGKTPNLAARLQSLATPGGIVIAETTRRLLGRTFEVKALGPQHLKGFGAPIPAWAVVREADNVGRFEAFQSGAMTPFVGREQEIALLVARWREVTVGEGQVVLLSGEAGIGKSRILAELREAIGGEQYRALRYQCSAHHANEAFYPVIDQLRRAAGLVGGEPAATQLNKLEAMIERSGGDVGQTAPYLAALLTIPGATRYPALEISTGELRDQTIRALVALFEAETRAAPVLALLEDAHWLDPSSVDLFSRLIDRLQGLCGLLIVTFRPDFIPPWVVSPHVTTLGLNRFGQRYAAALIDRITQGKSLPPEVLREIIAKADGVPLFLEELTKTVIESSLLREEDGFYVLAAELSSLAIPVTLRDALMARLDRLAAVKETAQIGAVIGREFSWQLIEAVSPIKGAALRDALGQLMAAQLIHVRGAPPEAVYVFKHALVQDAAYDSLLRVRRQRLHADIAFALSKRLVDKSESPAVVARHFTEANVFQQAAHYWLMAAELSLSASAHAEALHYADAGLASTAQMEEGDERQSLELGLHIARSKALLPLRGYNAPETVAALTAAKRLLDAGAGFDLQRFSVVDGLCAAEMNASRMEPALALAHQMTEAAHRQGDMSYVLIAHRQLAAVQVIMGRHREGLENLKLAELYRDPAKEKPLSHRFGVDPGLDLLAWKVLTLTHLGLLDKAGEVREQLRMELLEHRHPQTFASCTLHSVVWPALMLRDFEAAERCAADVVTFCTQKNIEPYRIFAAIFHACAQARRNPVTENIVAIRACLDVHHRSGGNVHESLFLAQLAEVLLIAGDVNSAAAALREAHAYVERSGAQLWLAELHRIDGLIALRADGVRANQCFLKSIDIAREQGAHILELRAAIELFRRWREGGSAEDPTSLLNAVLAGIRGGEDIRDVREARALLAS
jgi:class 3 adenylate cyclase